MRDFFFVDFLCGLILKPLHYYDYDYQHGLSVRYVRPFMSQRIGKTAMACLGGREGKREGDMDRRFMVPALLKQWLVLVYIAIGTW